eukprot:gene2423-60351_t
MYCCPSIEHAVAEARAAGAALDVRIVHYGRQEEGYGRLAGSGRARRSPPRRRAPPPTDAAPPAAAAAAPAAADGASGDLCIGAAVEVHGLKGAAELNGLRGRDAGRWPRVPTRSRSSRGTGGASLRGEITKQQGDRWGVQFGGSRGSKALRPCNLRVVCVTPPPEEYQKRGLYVD